MVTENTATGEVMEVAKVSQVIRQIKAGIYDPTLAALYGAADRTLETQRKRYIETLRGFEKNFGGERDIAIYSVPGRVELCGNHTDHNHGVVLAAAVDLDIIAAVSKTDNDTIRIRTKGYESGAGVGLSRLKPVDTERGKSAAMIRGVAAGIAEHGGKIGGFDAYTASNVLKGSGLSSSAAFEICVGTILNAEYNDERFTPIELGIIGQRAENDYFGKPSGLMDQISCAVGGVVWIDFANPSAPVVRKIPFDLSSRGFRLVVTDTGGSHSRLTEEYAAIRREMERVAHFFGKNNLREVSRDGFLARIPDVRSESGDRATLRALHFFEECRRVNELTTAAEQGDMERFLALITESGHSSFEYNQNAYPVGDPNRQSIPVALALSQLVLEGRGAWRLQGGGFAGTIQAFVPESLLKRYRSAMHAAFGENACYALSFREDGPLKVTKL